MRAPSFLEFLQAGDELFRKLAEVGIHNQEDLQKRIEQLRAEGKIPREQTEAKTK